MDVVIADSPVAAGRYAAAVVAARLNAVLAERERARLLLSTGESQFETLRELVRRPVDWRRVDGFHLDEYVDLPIAHPASFRRYLRERVAELVPITLHDVDPGSPEAMEQLRAEVAAAPMDVGLVGIGENGHVAFNDPPADFETTEPYLEVELDARCRAQQVREGWFPGEADVPRRAVTMSVHEIIRCREIVSVVPHAHKAPAVRAVVTAKEVTPELPASVLVRHPRAQLVIDRASAQLLSSEVWNRCVAL